MSDMRLVGFIILFLSLGSCDEDPVIDPGDLSDIPYQPTAYVLDRPSGFPQLEIPSDNPLTVEGIWLGRKLFFDPIVSADSTMSCSSCHLQGGNFTDNLKVSTGVDGIPGRRSAMSLLNVAFHYSGLFWDGRSPGLEEQALLPIEDPIELHESWPNVEEKLRRHPVYPADFRRAFGINHTSEISRDLATKAIAQFERTLISSGQSKYDRFMRGEIFLDDSEFNGMEMFFDVNNELPDAECNHCHAPPLFAINEFRNNGIEPVSSLAEFPDKGRGEVSGDSLDNGKFKTPTLRNIEFTAPYMHDGRFKNLEEVLDHYNSGGHRQKNTDPLIRPLGLTPAQKQDILAFLRTLADTTFLNNPDHSNPF
ncbi:MAG TPA: cytochrome c peroxidase [Saprospiraceae bacterium]|nr:cytochrome c peroxidase [Saprospiraceae bacterium]